MKNAGFTEKNSIVLERNNAREDWRKDFENKVKVASLNTLNNINLSPSKQDLSEKLPENETPKSQFFTSRALSKNSRNKHTRSLSHKLPAYIENTTANTTSKIDNDLEKKSLSLSKNFESVFVKQSGERKEEMNRTPRAKTTSIILSPRKGPAKTERPHTKIEGMSRLWENNVRNSESRKSPRDGKKTIKIASKSQNKISSMPNTPDESFFLIKSIEKPLTCSHTQRWPRMTSKRQSIDDTLRSSSIENTPSLQGVMGMTGLTYKSKGSTDDSQNHLKIKENLYNRLVVNKMSNEKLRKAFFESTKNSPCTSMKISNDFSVNKKAYKNSRIPWINLIGSPATTAQSFFETKNSPSSIGENTPKSYTDKLNTEMSQALKSSPSSSPATTRSIKGEYKRSNFFCDLAKDALDVSTNKTKLNYRALSVVNFGEL